MQAYWLDLEGQLGGIHPVFYVKLLEPTSTSKGPATLLEPLQGQPTAAHKGYKIEAILDCRAKPKVKYQVLYKS